jgi:hypothetical protein
MVQLFVLVPAKGRQLESKSHEPEPSDITLQTRYLLGIEIYMTLTLKYDLRAMRRVELAIIKGAVDLRTLHT